METKEVLAKWDDLFAKGRIAEALSFVEGEIAEANAAGAWEKELTLLTAGELLAEGYEWQQEDFPANPEPSESTEE